jgi:hypothetical protein
MQELSPRIAAAAQEFLAAGPLIAHEIFQQNQLPVMAEHGRKILAGLKFDSRLGSPACTDIKAIVKSGRKRVSTYGTPG